jgi:tetratricopeptide (TPR) repeat protein
MSKNDKAFSDLYRLIDSQNFKTQAEFEKYVNSLVGKPIPSLPKEKLSKKQLAQDLVSEAEELPPGKAKQKARQALKIDPNCIEAFELLGNLEHDVQAALPFYLKGINIGKRVFGGKYLEENKGHFWGIYETRPFMRCFGHYADCLYTLGKKQECVDILEEMIALNPNDNQGVRDQLLLYLIELDRPDKFKKYARQFKDDDCAFSLFNRALFSFKTDGENTKSNRLLVKALKQNKFVAARLLSACPSDGLTEMYGYGDDNEARYYAFFAHSIWRKIPSALNWLKNYNTAGRRS